MNLPKLILAFVILSLHGCQTTKKIKFEPANQEAEKISVSLVAFGQTNDGGEPLGTLPVEIDVEKISGKSLRLGAAGFSDQFWIVPENLGESSIVKIKLKPRSDDREKIAILQAKACLLLLKSYKALSEQKLDLAISLADQSETVLSLGPGPLIIKALAIWQKGDRTKAQTLMEEAKALYPNTQELDELLEAVKAN